VPITDHMWFDSITSLGKDCNGYGTLQQQTSHVVKQCTVVYYHPISNTKVDIVQLLLVKVHCTAGFVYVHVKVHFCINTRLV